MSDEYADVMAEDDDYEDVQGPSQFAPTIDWAETPVVFGVYEGSKEVETKNGMRTKHVFSEASTAASQDKGAPKTFVGDLESWDASVLRSRLQDLAGLKVRVTKTGKVLTSKNGRTPHEYLVAVARSAMSGGAR